MSGWTADDCVRRPADCARLLNEVEAEREAAKVWHAKQHNVIKLLEAENAELRDLRFHTKGLAMFVSQTSGEFPQRMQYDIPCEGYEEARLQIVWSDPVAFNAYPLMTLTPDHDVWFPADVIYRWHWDTPTWNRAKSPVKVDPPDHGAVVYRVRLDRCIYALRVVVQRLISPPKKLVGWCRLIGPGPEIQKDEDLELHIMQQHQLRQEVERKINVLTERLNGLQAVYAGEEKP